jgi:hypothetical protein
MPVIKFLLPLLLLAACASKDPKSMAKAYCQCFLDAGNDTEKLKSCEELAKTHAENLPKDQESQKIYAEEIIRCAVYEQKDTK